MKNDKWVLWITQGLMVIVCVGLFGWGIQQSYAPRPASTPLEAARIEWQAITKAACTVRLHQPSTPLALNMEIMYLRSAARYNNLVLDAWKAPVGFRPMGYPAAPPLDDACDDLTALGASL